MDTNEKIGIKGEELSYEDLFRKNKKRARGERHSFAVNSSSGPLQFNDGTRRNNKLKSMFNAPQSVRGIKRIEIEEKQKQQMLGNNPDQKQLRLDDPDNM